MSFTRAREFLLGAYHDLPNVLFMGSLVLGAMAGYLPLLWVAIGLILTGLLVAILQGILSLVFPTWSQVSAPAGSLACAILGRATPPGSLDGVTVVAPSHWLAASTFFAAFTIYNSIRLVLRKPTEGAAAEKVDMRRAFSLSVIVVGIAFFAMVLARGFSGCETWLGGSLGVLVGLGSAVGFWQLLDACGTGSVPDILQVVNSIAPAAEKDAVPVVCA
jgi:hypothetical protein